MAGFDFGTTNSLISFIQGNRPINCLDEEQRPTPSMICYEGAKTILGRDAKERLSKAGLGIHGGIVRSPKMYLGKENIFVEGVERNPVEVVADVVRYVYQQSGHVRRDVGDFSGVVVTIPVGMQGYQRRALRDAFRKAGLRIVQFVHEPFAALYGLFRNENLSSNLRRYDNKLILVFDWGGGTLDLTLCRLRDGMVVQLKNDGTYEVGGDVFDETIKARIVQNVTKSRGIDDSAAIHQGAESRLLDRCERAKIDLSDRSNAQIYVANFFKEMPDEELDYPLSRNELESIVKPLLDKGFKRIERILDDSGYSPEQIALCVATGGMSNMSIVSRRLHELFGPGRVEFPSNSATLIAEGAAWIAFDQVDLQLAKNLELVLARNSYLPLIKAGTSMPKESQVQADTFHLYCTDPRDGVAKFQFCSPMKPGPMVLRGEPRSYLENITVKVDAKTRPFIERLELDVKIDENLILDCHARSVNHCDEDRCEIHDLEFGLTFPESDQPTNLDDDLPEPTKPEGENPSPAAETGAISVRANIADKEDDALVPGEYLAQYNEEYLDKKHYFDVRHNRPDCQVEEKLYYEPCILCGRASNDPACKCATLL